MRRGEFLRLCFRPSPDTKLQASGARLCRPEAYTTNCRVVLRTTLGRPEARVTEHKRIAAVEGQLEVQFRVTDKGCARDRIVMRWPLFLTFMGIVEKGRVSPALLQALAVTKLQASGARLCRPGGLFYLTELLLRRTILREAY